MSNVTSRDLHSLLAEAEAAVLDDGSRFARITRVADSVPRVTAIGTTALVVLHVFLGVLFAVLGVWVMSWAHGAWTLAAGAEAFAVSLACLVGLACGPTVEVQR